MVFFAKITALFFISELASIAEHSQVVPEKKPLVWSFSFVWNGQLVLYGVAYYGLALYLIV